jgi:hypothetical protein
MTANFFCFTLCFRYDQILVNDITTSLITHYEITDHSVTVYTVTLNRFYLLRFCDVFKPNRDSVFNKNALYVCFGVI